MTRNKAFCPVCVILLYIIMKYDDIGGNNGNAD